MSDNGARVYVVRDDANELRLVEASSQAQAIRHVVGKRYTAKPATVADVCELVGGGMKVEKAGKETA